MKDLLRLLGLMIAGVAIMYAADHEELELVFAGLFMVAGLLLALIPDNRWESAAAVFIGASGGAIIVDEYLRDAFWFIGGFCFLFACASIKDHPERPTWKGSSLYYLTVGVLFVLSCLTNNPLLLIATGLCIFIFGGVRLWVYLGE